MNENLQPPPLVSVVMPVYNGEKYLREAVESILSQTFSDFEFIIVDDASTDSTSEILAEYAALDSRIKVLQNQTNQRPSNSANRAISLARGRYIARMDADDVAFPNRIAEQLRTFEAHPNAVFVGSGYEDIDTEGKSTKTTIEGGTMWECAWISLFRMPVVHSTAIIRTDIITDNSLKYDDQYDGAADFEFFHKLLRYGDGVCTQKKLLKYRTHNENVSTKKNEKQRQSTFKAGIKNTIKIFPNISREELESLYGFLTAHASPRALNKKTLSALDKLEASFIEKFKLDPSQQEIIKILSARMIAIGIFRNHLHKNALALLYLPWLMKNGLVPLAKEAKNAIHRRSTFTINSPRHE